MELPPDCEPYDPEAAMRLNEAYRDRLPLSPEQEVAAGSLVPEIREALEAVRRTGGGEEGDVRAALEEAGLVGVQSRTSGGDVLFGAMTAEGACVHGALSVDAVTVDAGGLIMDGGCLPAQ